MTQYWGGDTSHFFLLILYNFKKGYVPPPPYSAVSVLAACDGCQTAGCRLELTAVLQLSDCLVARHRVTLRRVDI